MKKKALYGLGIIVLAIAATLVATALRDMGDADMLSGLEGTIFYEKRVDGTKVLFSSDANTQNEKIVYSHKGKGRDNYGDFNDNILEYHVDPESGHIDFVAMYEGEWSLFSLPFGEEDAVLLGKAERIKDGASFMESVDYLKRSVGDRSVLCEAGSIYLVEKGNQRLIKKFWGIYDEKFTGYGSIGFSPDGDYLVYWSMGHLTPIGTMLDGMLTGHVGRTYIMDLQTGRSTRYPDARDIQWLSSPEIGLQ